jgi:hypothetical protein
MSRRFLSISIAISCALSGQAAWAAIEKPIVSFNFSNGSFSQAGLVADKAGDLYGSTVDGGSGAGLIFELTPPVAGQTAWTETVIYDFAGTPDGSVPIGTLAIDAKGNLYGTTYYGGTAGVGNVFMLTPPSAGSTTWNKTDLYDFISTTNATLVDGTYPAAGVILDANGALYGTTVHGGYNPSGEFGEGDGIAYKLTPPASGNGAWTETVLYRFNGTSSGSNPEAPLIMDEAGALYGTTAEGGNTACLQVGCGVVFRLNPPNIGQPAWTTTVLHRFAYVEGGADGRAPVAGLVADTNGTLYGTTLYGGNGPFGSCGYAGCGTVFQLTPPKSGQGSWTETILHSFTGGSDGVHPEASLLLSAKGVLNGTTTNGGSSGWGTVFTLAPPAKSGNPWTENVIYRFQGAPNADGAYPEAELISDVSGNLYGTTSGGGLTNPCGDETRGCGTVFEVTP